MSQPLYLRTDEKEEAIRSLEWGARLMNSVLEEPYLWKWILIALHNSAQGFMVVVLSNGNGLLTLRDKVAEKWMDAYDHDKPFPVEKLEEFLSLYKKTKDKNNFHIIGAAPFLPGTTHDNSFERLNSLRNDFIHFTPKGWSLELRGLPHICSDVLDLIDHFGWGDAAVHWNEEEQLARTKESSERIRVTLRSVESAYVG